MEDISVKFIFEGNILTIQCKKNDYMKDIFKKYAVKVNKDIDHIYSLYGGDMINKEAQLSKFLKEDKEVVILVIELNEEINEILKISKDIICPCCKEICVLKFKDYKISLTNCLNSHFFSNILFEQFNDFQKINESTIKCNNCNNNKEDTNNNQFYKCYNCNINICPSCKLSHDNNHKILDYEQKNYNCNQHGEKCLLYCNDCNENLCELCKSSNKHKEHKEIHLNTILKSGGNNLNKLRLKINNLKDEIKNIIQKFNKVISNLETYYNISNKIINDYNENYKNYQILTNINNINEYNEQIINDIDKILKEDKFKNQVNYFADIYEKMIFYNEITLKYSIKKEKGKK